MAYTFTQELQRKGIHLSSICIVLVLYALPKTLALSIALILFIGMLIIDLLRLNGQLIILPSLFREHEARSFCGATYMLFSIFICYILFGDYIFLTAMLILMIADAIAAIIGMRYGKFHILDKTLEGSTAFFVSSMLIYLVVALFTGHFNEKNLLAGVIACICTTFAELISRRIRIDDNLLVPLTYGIVFTIVIRLSFHAVA